MNVARELLLCALETDASHVQALYNLGNDCVKIILLKHFDINYFLSLYILFCIITYTYTFCLLMLVCFLHIGLVYKKENLYEEALECFWKIRNIVRHDPQTLYQIGHLYQLMTDIDQASEWYFNLYFIFIFKILY